ncbi:hypothetical protein BV25DRAFT_1906973 [Artomyces pyxidatus]|uniref:Uncharacterized protein n=1 Tax=Artomyces pyxidatus TaxID=48021 RepID=A0ACB8T479_9AGAM|nr:hypothetical protein BV25DRAFT_1906973 [Artomyces pyxidatus]
MTRYTNFGRKRTYVDAGFSDETSAEASTSTAHLVDSSQDQHGSEQPPVKDKRKRSKNGKSAQVAGDTAGGGDGHSAKANEESGTTIDGGVAGDSEDAHVARAKVRKDLVKLKEKQSAWRRKDIADRAAASEQRRLKRLAERHANTTCFACRETGHAARECPNVKSEQTEGGKGKGREVLGICYRCGSQKHTLSRCRKTVNESNPLPFASCFVCSGKGHLASACPENKSKGIYPNGGSCKLCGETTHLAKDCGLRKPEPTARSVLLGTGRGAGADEDDFHTLKRKTIEIDREEHSEERVKKMAKLKVGAHSGIVKPFGVVPARHAKKVVYF